MTLNKEFHPAGFQTAGVSAGIKSTRKPDLALVVNTGPEFNSAVVFTSNRAKANPILWSQAAYELMNPKAIILNSGGANCFTGEFGYETSRLTATAVAEELSFHPEEVLVASTGLIGVGDLNFRNKILDCVPALKERLQDTESIADEAILTTDTVSKRSLFVHPDGWRISGFAKGAGMLAPGLATMLVVIMTDASVVSAKLQEALKEAVSLSFNRLDSDGCMSTNDQVTLFSSGGAGVVPEFEDFQQALISVTQELAKQLQQDAEGASHNIDIRVVGAKSTADAEEVGRSLARNNLFKAAIFGNDPNWGRVLAAIGTTQADFDPYLVDVSFNGIRLCSMGGPDRPVSECDLTPRQTDVLIDLNTGSDHEVTILTNDLTHDYVHENSAYSS